MKVDDNTMDVTTFRFALLYFVLNRDFPTSQHSIRLLLFPELLSRASGRCSNVAEVRLLRYWEARHVRKGGELMSVDMLFVNENDLLVQTVSLGSGNVSARALSTRTSLEKITASARPIPTELLRFMPYGQILELANTGKQLPDIIGELNAIRSTITDRIPGAQRVMLTLRLESYGREPKIIIATSVNPKIVGVDVFMFLNFGRLFLNATSGTHLYFDSETAAGKKVFDTYLARSADLGAFTSKVVRAQKIEPMTTSELNQFIITADSQIIEFLCTAKFTGIQQDDGWCYIGCSGYRITLSVSDYTDTASFLAFDMEMAKLTNVQASEAAQIVGIGVDAQHQTFTISRIFPERVLVPMPAFVEVANVPADAQAEDVAQGTNANVGITSTGADKPTISDASTGKRPPPAKDQDDVDKTAPKKAHVE
ncbi:hypothetical protein HID58_087882 [Brassica napus]|uniref:Uncharacterized protein n=1 Tax=Brassica napus TaxID=3708 RepID=A0ABQ7XUM5_BRANA|nr:hypothetical protein HID58_087882 [Brassica napus]